MVHAGRPGRPASARWRRARGAPVFFRLVSFSGSSTFSSAVSTGIRLNCWKMKPTCSLRQRAIWRSFSCAQVVPEHADRRRRVGRSMAAIRCSRVDLPEPEGPISATNSPLWISMSHVLQRDDVELVAHEFLGQILWFR